MEKDLSILEGKAAKILHECISLFDEMKLMDYLHMEDDDRWILSSYIAVQFLRTSGQRDILALFAQLDNFYKGGLSEDEKVNLHVQMLCSGGLVEEISERIFESIWIYARNQSSTPLWISDNPIAFKTSNNRQWLKGPGIFSRGSYVVFPITPKYVLYCKEPEYWSDIKRADSCLSPVELTDEMVKHENAGQVFMATRHVMSSINGFSWADEFVKSIGTDIYAQENEK